MGYKEWVRQAFPTPLALQAVHLFSEGFGHRLIVLLGLSLPQPVETAEIIFVGVRGTSFLNTQEPGYSRWRFCDPSQGGGHPSLT